MNKEEIVIVIPVYKNKLDVFERASLDRCRRVFCCYHMVFIAPEGVELDYGNLGKDIMVERLPAAYFRSKFTYSEIMLTANFYKRFFKYRYMLIYQLDAFVFSDRLLEFCEMNYDYIGSPMQRFAPNWLEAGCNIGNGGFSLRKIESCFRVTQNFDAIAKRAPYSWMYSMFLRAEDVFFAFCSTLSDLYFNVPPFFLALDFGVGQDLAHVYKRMPSWLPFGCHAWSECDYWHWRPIIESFGYELPEKRGDAMQSNKFLRARFYALVRLIRHGNACNCRLAIGAQMNAFSKGASIWGWGKYGKLGAALLENAGFRIVRVYDKMFDTEKMEVSCSFLQPTDEAIMQESLPILVSTIKYEKEITRHLESLGKKRGEYYLLSDIMSNALQLTMKRLT